MLQFELLNPLIIWHWKLCCVFPSKYSCLSSLKELKEGLFIGFLYIEKSCIKDNKFIEQWPLLVSKHPTKWIISSMNNMAE